MNAFVNHLTFEFKTGIRNKNLLMLNYLFPLGFYAMMGLIMTEINPGFQEVMVPAMVTFAILASTLLGIPDPLVIACQNGIFRSFKINGVPAHNIVIIQALTSMLHMTVMALIVALTAPLFFGAPAPENWLNFVLVYLVGAFASAGIAILIGVISSSSRVTVLWAQAIFLPSMMLGGMMMPLSILPAAAQKFALMLSGTHTMIAFNGLAMGTSVDTNPWTSLLILVVGGLAALGLSLYLFKWDSKNRVNNRSPLLALLALLPYAASLLFL